MTQQIRDRHETMTANLMGSIIRRYDAEAAAMRRRRQLHGWIIAMIVTVIVVGAVGLQVYFTGGA